MLAVPFDDVEWRDPVMQEASGYLTRAGYMALVMIDHGSSIQLQGASDRIRGPVCG
jgi:hypothetical protein